MGQDVAVSKTTDRMPMAPKPNTAQLKGSLCLPAPVLPAGGAETFDTSPLYRQLSDKPLLVLCRINWGVGRKAQERVEKISAEHIHFRNRRCPKRVTGRLPEPVSAAAAVLQIAAGLLHRVSRRTRAKPGRALPRRV